MSDVRLTEAEREAIVCDCAVALATDCCPTHAGDDSIWSEQPASHILATVERIVADRVREAEQRGAEKVHARVEAAISNTDASWGGAAMVVRDKVRVALTPERKRTSDHTETAAEFIARADRLAGDER